MDSILGFRGQLHGAQLMQQPETRNPVEQLEEMLHRAALLVRSCRCRGYLYWCFMGARHANELHEVQDEIFFYLQLFPLVSYVDTTLTWVRLLNKSAAAAADPSGKEAPVEECWSPEVSLPDTESGHAVICISCGRKVESTGRSWAPCFRWEPSEEGRHRRHPNYNGFFMQRA